MLPNVLKDVTLARHTTLRVGGKADYFVRVDSREELIEAVGFGKELHLDIFILGKGSNILVRDAGIRGLVIENRSDSVDDLGRRTADGEIGREPETREPKDEPQKKHVIAESGASLPGLANRLARQGWSGMEWAIGVPATVGAAVVTNAGAHGGAMSDQLVRAEILTVRGGDEIRWWTREELGYEYRTSYLKEHGEEFVVLGAELELVKDEAALCIARMNQYSEHRRRTQPTEPSVGSMFKNPEGDYAGRLIEAAGLKGTRVGQVQVSQVHGNFFVNLGGATASEVLDLIELVKNRVLERFGVGLELEIQVVGEE